MSDDEGDLGRYRRAMTPLRDANMGNSTLTLEDISFAQPDDARSVDSNGSSTIVQQQHKLNKIKRQKQLFYVFTVMVGVTGIASVIMFCIAIVYTVAPDGLRAQRAHVQHFEEKLLVPLPSNYEHILDVANYSDPGNEDAVAVVWDIPGDGDILQHILSSCVGAVAAGGAISDGRQTHVKIHEELEVFENKRGRFVNCFAGTQKGIDRIIERNLMGSGKADVVYAPLIYEVGPAFTEAYPGKLTAMFHDPVQRVASVYHVVKQIIPSFQNKTLEEFLGTLTGANNNNWMTRELANCGLDELNDECLRIAKEIVQKKIVVGVTTDIDASLENMYNKMGWSENVTAGGEDFLTCAQAYKDGVGLDRLYTDLVEEGSPEYMLIASQNSYDIELYEEAKKVFASYR